MFKKFSEYHGPKVFEFIDPDRPHHHYAAPDKKTLMDDILSYREQNRLSTIESLSTVIDNYLCDLPIHCGACIPVKIHRSFMQYVRGGIALLKNMLYSNLVSQEEADRRAAICIGCDENIFPDRGEFLEWSDKIAEACTNGRKAIGHADLGSCKICTCTLKALVWQGDIVVEPEKKDLYPIHCWKLATLENK